MSEDSDTDKKKSVATIVDRLSKDFNNKSDSVMSRSPTELKAKRARALFSYSPEQEDELKLEVEDIIDVVEEVEEGWWRGKLKGKTGVFPSNFVEVVTETNGAKSEKSDDESKSDAPVIQPKKQPQGFGFGNIFQGQPPIELRTTPKGSVGGDMTAKRRTIEPISKDEKIEHNELSVEEKKENLKPTVKPKEEKGAEEYAKALFQYEADNNDEMSLEVGDIVTVLKKECEDPGWWYGELNGRKGLFPDNFVKLIPPEEAIQRKAPHTPPAVPVKPKHFGSNATISSAATPPLPAAVNNSSASYLRSNTPEPHPMKLDYKSTMQPSVPTEAAPIVKPKLSQSPATVIPSTSTPPPTDVKENKKETTGEMAATEPTRDRSSLFGGKKPIGGFALPGLAGKLGLGPKLPDKSKERASEEPKVPEKGKDEKGEKEKDLDKLGSLEGPERLNHPTASRPKNPSKRPPSTVFLQSLGKDISSPVAEEKGPAKSPSADSLDSKAKNHSVPSSIGNGDFVSRAEYDRLKAEFDAFRLETSEKIKALEARLARL